MSNLLFDEENVAKAKSMSDLFGDSGDEGSPPNEEKKPKPKKEKKVKKIKEDKKKKVSTKNPPPALTTTATLAAFVSATPVSKSPDPSVVAPHPQATIFTSGGKGNVFSLNDDDEGDDLLLFKGMGQTKKVEKAEGGAREGA